jgi:hypothetical protein
MRIAKDKGRPTHHELFANRNLTEDGGVGAGTIWFLDRTVNVTARRNVITVVMGCSEINASSSDSRIQAPLYKGLNSVSGASENSRP